MIVAWAGERDFRDFSRLFPAKENRRQPENPAFRRLTSGFTFTAPAEEKEYTWQPIQKKTRS
jgi:hypothetical protein